MDKKNKFADFMQQSASAGATPEAKVKAAEGMQELGMQMLKDSPSATLIESAGIILGELMMRGEAGPLMAKLQALIGLGSTDMYSLVDSLEAIKKRDPESIGALGFAYKDKRYMMMTEKDCRLSKEGFCRIKAIEPTVDCTLKKFNKYKETGDIDG
jgi:hypothetical protein